MFRAGIHTQTGGPYFRAGTNTGNRWVPLLCSIVSWLVGWFVGLLIIPTVFHVPINGLGVHLKHIQSGDRVVTCDHVHDQSLGRSCDTFPGSRACISRDPQVVEMSCDRTCDRSGDSFPGSRGWRVDSTTWLYFSLGAALGGLGLGILWMRDVADFVLDSIPSLGFCCACNTHIPSLGFCLERNSQTSSFAWVNSLASNGPGIQCFSYFLWVVTEGFSQFRNVLLLLLQFLEVVMWSLVHVQMFQCRVLAVSCGILGEFSSLVAMQVYNLLERPIGLWMVHSVVVQVLLSGG